MKKKDLAEFKNILVMERQAVFANLRNLSDTSATNCDTGPGDEVDLASQIIAQTQVANLGVREQKLLDEIELALERIQSGEFGICQECGDSIATGRLRARPFSVECVDCKSLEENRASKYANQAFKEEEEPEWSSELNEQ